MNRFLLLSVLIPLLLPASGFAQWSSGRPDGHAPIGVMGDHTHGKGEFMLAYRFMTMAMAGNRDGTQAVDATAVADPAGFGFRISPTEMRMSMHMFGLMVAPASGLTLMLMVPITAIGMDHRTRAGMEFETTSAGLGDVSLTALIGVADFGRQSLVANVGIGLPTGSIDAMDVTPASAPDQAQLPYPMQPGSGTFDARPGLTWLGQTEDWSWGGQAGATLRLGENDRMYRLGNRGMLTAWGARRVSSWISVSARATAATWGNVTGGDPALAGMVSMNMVPTARPDLRAGSRLNAALGINVYVRSGPLRGVRFAAEATAPAYQSLDGPQLETDTVFLFGIQYAR